LILEGVFSIFPTWALCLSYIKILYRARFYQESVDLNLDPWSYSGCRIQLIGLMASMVVYPILTFLLRMRPRVTIAASSLISHSMDASVNSETARVKDILDKNLPQEQITVGGLTKKFGDFQAVKGTSFSLKKHECFILLGINGAGKSTTFKCLTAEERVTTGNIVVDGVNIEEFYSNPEKMGRMIGYCPQTNPLIEILTVQENLRLFLILKGASPEKAPQLGIIIAKKF
jgi:ABC-type multidrug transport system fused ATPase/permease subunit